MIWSYLIVRNLFVLDSNTWYYISLFKNSEEMT